MGLREDSEGMAESVGRAENDPQVTHVYMKIYICMGATCQAQSLSHRLLMKTKNTTTHTHTQMGADLLKREVERLEHEVASLKGKLHTAQDKILQLEKVRDRECAFVHRMRCLGSKTW